MPERARWRDHPARAELLALFKEADALASSAVCTCAAATQQDDARCCQFTRNGREPYPTPVELCEVDLGLRARGQRVERAPPRRRGLPQVDAAGACPLLSAEGRCTIYASRPFGCRTYFCPGHEPPRAARDALQALGRRILDLSTRLFPRDPGPRPFTRALAGPLPAAPPLPTGRPAR